MYGESAVLPSVYVNVDIEARCVYDESTALPSVYVNVDIEPRCVYGDSTEWHWRK